jgi:hypothetical protein
VDWISREFLLAVVGSLAITVLILLFLPHPPLAHAPNANTCGEACNSTGGVHSSDGRPDESFEIPYIGIKIGEALLALFTLLLWWSTRDLVKESRRTAERQLRAYLSVETGTVTFQRKALRFEFRPVVFNNGDTPASDVMIVSSLGLVHPQIPPNFDYTLPMPGNNVSVATIAAHKDKFHQAVFGRKATTAELRLIKKNELVFHLYGTVHYKDIFKIDRTTNFSFRINVFGRRAGTFWGSTERHNDTT